MTTIVYIAMTGAWYNEYIDEDEVNGTIEDLAAEMAKEAIEPPERDEHGVWHVPDPSNTGYMHFSTDREALQRYLDSRGQLIIGHQ